MKNERDKIIIVRNIQTNENEHWTVGQLIHRINEDNVTDKFNYCTEDWQEGFKETLTEFYSLFDNVGHPLNPEPVSPAPASTTIDEMLDDMASDLFDTEAAPVSDSVEGFTKWEIDAEFPTRVRTSSFTYIEQTIEMEKCPDIHEYDAFTKFGGAEETAKRIVTCVNGWGELRLHHAENALKLTAYQIICERLEAEHNELVIALKDMLTTFNTYDTPEDFIIYENAKKILNRIQSQSKIK